MALRGRPIIAGLAAAAVACLTIAAGAHGACAVTAESVAAADVVFVGLLRGIDQNGVASFQVEEVWRGKQFVTGETVNIEAANVGIEVPPDPDANSSRYLVLASERDGVLRTGDSPANLCARFPYPWDASYAALRPPGADRQPAMPVEGGGVPWLPVALGTAAIAVGLAAFLITPGGRRLRGG